MTLVSRTRTVQNPLSTDIHNVDGMRLHTSRKNASADLGMQALKHLDRQLRLHRDMETLCPPKCLDICTLLTQMLLHVLQRPSCMCMLAIVADLILDRGHQIHQESLHGLLLSPSCQSSQASPLRSNNSERHDLLLNGQELLRHEIRPQQRLNQQHG